MSADEEIDAMKTIAGALEPLDEITRKRVLAWAGSRFGWRPSTDANESRNSAQASERRNDPSNATEHPETFAELFEAAGPNTDKEKALVASYWQQVCLGQASFASQTLNTDLKDLGHGVSNITEALSALKNERPALVLQLKKSGTSRQARKTYKITQEGMKRVQAMSEGSLTTNDSQ